MIIIKAIFYRNVKNFKELRIKENSIKGCAKEYTILTKYRFENTNEETIFLNDFSKVNSYLLKYREYTKVTDHEWICVELEIRQKDALLIVFNRYNYPRFIAIK